MGQAWEAVIDLWETGNWWARAAIIVVFVPPLVALFLALYGLNPAATAVALTPILELVFVSLALLDPLVIVVAAGALGLHPTAEAVRRWLAHWIPLYIGSVLAYGVYLFFVPISKNPVLVLPLVAAVGAVALLAIAGARGTAVWWAKFILTTVAIGITVAFFFSGRAEEAVEAVVQAGVSEAPRVEEFTLNANEEQFTVLNGPGTLHRIRADKSWVAFSYRPDGSRAEHKMPAGSSSWQGGSPEGLLRVKGVEDGTTLRFERVP